jgi:hypothetical protein
VLIHDDCVIIAGSEESLHPPLQSRLLERDQNSGHCPVEKNQSLAHKEKDWDNPGAWIVPSHEAGFSPS